MIWLQETKNCKWRGPEDWNNHVKQFLCLQYGLQPVYTIPLNTHKDNIVLVGIMYTLYFPSLSILFPKSTKEINDIILINDAIVSSRKRMTSYQTFHHSWKFVALVDEEYDTWYYHRCPFKQDIGHTNAKKVHNQLNI